MWSELYMLHDIYAKLLHSLLYCSPITMHPPSPSLLLLLLLFLLSSFPRAYSVRSSPRVLPDLASFSRSRLLAASISYTPPHRHQHPPIRHPARTYIAARNAESYSVSLDSLKQVLMSCTPTPPLRPSILLTTQHSSRSLSYLPCYSHSLAFPCR